MIKLPARFVPISAAKSGGMSSVIPCNDTRLQRKVIIKHLDPSTDQQRLLDEIRALQSIRSAYVVQIYDVISDSAGDIVGVAEEFCEGSDLSDWIGKVSQQQFLRFGYQLISGIAEVHDHDIIHRDIKPHNVRIGALDRLTIIDFGLASASHGANTVSAIGTSGFMAPELFVANSKGIISFTAAVDVFAFASSMYILATGTLPAKLCKRPPLLGPGLADFSKLPFSIDPDLAMQLGLAHEAKPTKRPTARSLQESFKRVLLRGQHRALINKANNPQYLDAKSPTATASIPGLASVTIKYDGDSFVVTAVSGDLYVNAGKVAAGFKFPGSCVITFGAPELKGARQYITFDVSHPGVVI